MIAAYFSSSFQYITDYLTDRGWSVELDSFCESTVIGPKTFHNIIGRLPNVLSVQNLILACHYDSKDLPNFHGSIDSAMPCAILLKVADILTDSITRQKVSFIDEFAQSELRMCSV